MTDTHAHLYDEQFDGDRDAIIARAVECGVEHILLPNIDHSTVQPMFDLCRRYPRYCYPMIGLHPTSVDAGFENRLMQMEPHLSRENIVAIGETGMDLYWDRQYLPQQIEAFRMQLGWAKRYNLPVVIHCRKSYNEILPVIKAEQDGRLCGVFHCFPGNIRQAEEITQMGFALGIGGVVTYNNAEMAKVIQHIGIEHVLVETDAPYLSPVPFRGKRNESSYIVHTIEKIASLKKMRFEEVATATDLNAKRIFPKIR